MVCINYGEWLHIYIMTTEIAADYCDRSENERPCTPDTHRKHLCYLPNGREWEWNGGEVWSTWRRCEVKEWVVDVAPTFSASKKKSSWCKSTVLSFWLFLPKNIHSLQHFLVKLHPYIKNYDNKNPVAKLHFNFQPFGLESSLWFISVLVPWFYFI